MAKTFIFPFVLEALWHPPVRFFFRRSGGSLWLAKSDWKSNVQIGFKWTLKILTKTIWLVVSTPLKNISQNGNLPQVGVKIKNIWNHHLDMILQFLEMKKKHRHVLAHTVFATKPTSEEKIARVTTWISPSGVEVILAIASAATQDHDMSSWHQNTGWKSILQSHIYIPGCLWK